MFQRNNVKWNGGAVLIALVGAAVFVGGCKSGDGGGGMSPEAEKRLSAPPPAGAKPSAEAQKAMADLARESAEKMKANPPKPAGQ